MKAVALTGIKEIDIVDIAKPAIINDDDVLLKIEQVGVCGSDVHYYETGKIGSQVVKYPFIVGHECATSVVEVGKAVKTLNVADRVVVDPAISCYDCDQCNQGRENTCRNLKFLGCPGQIEGCLCEYIVMPEKSLFAMSDSMTFEQAVLCEPLAIGIYAVEQATLNPDANIAILGSGPIGLSCQVSAKAENIDSIFMTDRIDERAKIALDAGSKFVGNPDDHDIVKEILDLCPQGMDAVFECAGQQQTIDQSIELLKPGGKLMLIGIPREERISFAIDKMRRKEITIINVRRQCDCTSKAVDLIGSKKADVDFMITHRFKLEDTKTAFDMVASYDDGVIKALIEF